MRQENIRIILQNPEPSERVIKGFFPPTGQRIIERHNEVVASGLVPDPMLVNANAAALRLKKELSEPGVYFGNPDDIKIIYNRDLDLGI